MAGFDGTGPQGMGPMSGWGRGRCKSSGGGFDTPYGGAGFGRRRGGRGGRCFGGRAAGWRNCQDAAYPSAPGDELENLKAQAGSLRGMLERVMSRIDALEKKEG